ncbi:MAG TPA: transposase, partial [Pirellulales bacterium]|jgi:putative transposase|nr:transposase [Pirellulales bacterium]
MPRRARSIVGGLAYHILNRANGRLRLFKKDADFAAFEAVLAEAHERVPLRILGYVVMPNHWHFVVWPRAGEDRQVSEFFRWLTVTHTQRWHAHHGTSGTGHLYQGRFKSFPLESDEHLWTVLRYVERNPLRAKLVTRAEQWRWGSLYRRIAGTSQDQKLLSVPAGKLPRHWLAIVNRAETEAQLAALRDAVRRGQPYGEAAWQAKIARQLGLQHTFRPRGRPFKNPQPPTPNNDSRPL